jgi:hypothetical protein
MNDRDNTPHLTNDDKNGGGALGELIRLQAEFQTKLAEETMRYLRRVQGAMAPAAPGTVVMGGGDLSLSTEGAVGGRATVRLAVENLQRMHCVVTPQLAPLVSATGTTWFPVTEPASMSRLLAPGESDTLELVILLPETLPPGSYRGALILQGFREGAIPVTVTVTGATKTPAKKRGKGRKAR